MTERVPIALKRMTVQGVVREAGDPVSELLKARTLRAMLDSNFVCWPEDLAKKMNWRMAPSVRMRMKGEAPTPPIPPEPDVAEAAPDAVETPVEAEPDGYVCDECGDEFGSKRGLKTHVRKMHA